MREVERYTGQRLTPMKVPTLADVAARRMALFKERILKTLDEEELEVYLALVEELAAESGRDITEIAAAAARLARGDQALVVPLEPEPEQVAPTESGMVRLFIEAGRQAGVRPSDIVGAIANEADLPGKLIGAIDIYDEFTFVEVPAHYQEQVLAGMAGARIRNQRANIRLVTVQDQAPRKPQKWVNRPPVPRKPFSSLQKKRGARWDKNSGPGGRKKY